MSKLEERLARLTGGKDKNRNIDKVPETITKIDKRKFNRGHKGSGRKPKEANLIASGIREYLDKHYQENIKIEIVDPKTGKKKIIEKPRVVRVLELLYDIGVKDRNPDALSKWLDRALGRPAQPIIGDEDKPIMLKIDF